MKADLGWVWADDVPPGAYSTSTPFMLLPGTLGRTWSKTIVTLALLVSCAMAGLKASIAAIAPHRIRRCISCLLVCSSVPSAVRGHAIEPILVGGRAEMRV